MNNNNLPTVTSENLQLVSMELKSVYNFWWIKKKYWSKLKLKKMFSIFNKILTFLSLIRYSFVLQQVIYGSILCFWMKNLITLQIMTTSEQRPLFPDPKGGCYIYCLIVLLWSTFYQRLNSVIYNYHLKISVSVEFQHFTVSAIFHMLNSKIAQICWTPFFNLWIIFCLLKSSFS